MKKSIVLVIALCAVFVMSAQNFKFGHINSQELMGNLPAMEAVMSQLETLQTNNNELLKNMQAELEKEAMKYQAAADTMPESVRAYKEQELQQMQANIQKFYQDAQTSMQKKQGELTQPVMDKVKKAIDDVAAEQGFIYVFDLSGGAVLYHSTQSVDIKPLVRKKLGLE